MNPGDEDAAERSLGHGWLALHERDVGDHDTGLLEQAQLQLERRGVPERLQERSLPELLRNDDVDEVGLLPGHAPDELEQRLHSSFRCRDELEPWRPADPLEPPGVNGTVCPAARRVNGTEVGPGDLACVPDGPLGRLVDGVDADQGSRRGRRGGDDRGCAGAQAAGGAAVVAVDPEERQDEQRDRDDHDPGALGELRRR